MYSKPKIAKILIRGFKRSFNMEENYMQIQMQNANFLLNKKAHFSDMTSMQKTKEKSI